MDMSDDRLKSGHDCANPSGEMIWVTFTKNANNLLAVSDREEA